MNVNVHDFSVFITDNTVVSKFQFALSSRCIYIRWPKIVGSNFIDFSTLCTY